MSLRDGEATTAPPDPAAGGRIPPDPRPLVVQDGARHLLEGGRCRDCAHALVLRSPRCPRCGGDVDPERFGPEGSVWAVTVVHVTSGGRSVPYTLAYVDLDDGPRLLSQIVSGRPGIGQRVRLTESTAHGDPAAEMIA